MDFNTAYPDMEGIIKPSNNPDDPRCHQVRQAHHFQSFIKTKLGSEIDMPGFLPMLHLQQPLIWMLLVFQHFQLEIDLIDRLEKHEE